MPLFLKKPVVIEARRATGSSESNREIINWTRGSPTPASMDDRPSGEGKEKCLTINTLEGARWVTPGDWIIKGPKGEFYPCKPNIFAAAYEAVTPGDWIITRDPELPDFARAERDDDAAHMDFHARGCALEAAITVMTSGNRPTHEINAHNIVDLAKAFYAFTGSGTYTITTDQADKA